MKISPGAFSAELLRQIGNAYQPRPAFTAFDRIILVALQPAQVRALYGICMQAVHGQQSHADDFFDSKEISADAAALAGLCLNELSRLSTETVDNL